MERKKGYSGRTNQAKLIIREYCSSNPLDTQNVRLAIRYARARMVAGMGRNERSKEIIRGLIKRPGYDQFEKDHNQLLAELDILFTGETRWIGTEAHKKLLSEKKNL